MQVQSRGSAFFNYQKLDFSHRRGLRNDTTFTVAHIQDTGHSIVYTDQEFHSGLNESWNIILSDSVF